MSCQLTGVPTLDGVKHLTLSGIVNSGAARLVLPQRAVDELRLQRHGETVVRYADHRQEKRPVVSPTSGFNCSGRRYSPPLSSLTAPTR